jgi:hypothetical protein
VQITQQPKRETHPSCTDLTKGSHGSPSLLGWMKHRPIASDDHEEAGMAKGRDKPKKEAKKPKKDKGAKKGKGK